MTAACTHSNSKPAERVPGRVCLDCGAVFRRLLEQDAAGLHANACPKCLHTRCGPECSCDCQNCGICHQPFDLHSSDGDAICTRCADPVEVAEFCEECGE